MMTDHLKALQQAREQMVAARRGYAEELSKPSGRDTTPGLRTTFIEIQNVIDQIDKAIKDEQKLAPTPPIKRFDKDNPYSEEPPGAW
jgi:hypothetical protein